MDKVISPYFNQHKIVDSVKDKSQSKSERVAPQKHSMAETIADNAKKSEKAYEEIKAKFENAIELVEDRMATEETIKDVSQELYELLSSQHLSIRYDIISELENKLIVKMVRKATGEVVWQYPPERTISLQKLAKYMPGIFLDTVV